MGANHDVMQRFFPAMFGRDRETLTELLDPDVVWNVPPFVVERFGDVRGRDAVIDWLLGAGEEFYDTTSFVLKPEVEAIEGDQGITLGWVTGRFATGEPYENRYAFGFHFQQGRISAVWEVLDSIYFEGQRG